MSHLPQIQKQAATPYVVLSGTIKPGQSRDAASGFATVDRMEEGPGAPTPVLGRLGGGQTPLVGNAKVSRLQWATAGATCTARRWSCRL
jgi:hypothetical protein